MKLYISRGTLIGFVISISILLSLGYASFLYINNLVRLSQWSAHARLVLFHAEQIRTYSMEVQSLHLRYVISGDEQYLKGFESSTMTLRNHINELDSLIADNSSQRIRVGQLRITGEMRSAFSAKVIAARKDSYQAAQALMLTRQGDNLMEKFQKQVDGIQSEENNLVRQRSLASNKEFYQFGYAFAGLLIAMLMILLVLFQSVNNNLKARKEAEEKLKKTKESAEDLYQNAPCGYFSFNKNGTFSNINRTLLDWLGYQDENEVVGKLRISDVLKIAGSIFYKDGQASFIQEKLLSNIEAEMVLKNGKTTPIVMTASPVMNEKGIYIGGRCTVFDSTEIKKAEDEAARSNKELEAFSYSVSHDLRAPLRSVDGYAQILKEDYGKQLDDEGQRVVNVIINNARRMGQLIDDLLDFSRTSRRDMNRTNFKMEELVKPMLKELMEAQGSRVIHLDLQELGSAYADLNMLRQVWVNLLSNALKYTQKTPEAVIVVGKYEEGNEIIYFVKDNGVGFDMQYYDKLFGVFQRLHKAHDFEGTGVGLALVKRIIDRHNGRIWGEARLNEGATFYFSIPKSQ